MPRPKSWLRLVVEPLAIALFLAVAVRSLVQVYAIPSGSMQPTLQVGDHIAVTPYRFGAAPARGDVIVFRSPANPGEVVVKRIIAAPGDLIASQAGRVTIGGRPFAEPYAGMAATGDILPQIVPSGCYFVMGDNRRASFDSRRWGVLPERFIVGRARLVLWSREASSPGETAFAAMAPEKTDEHSPSTRPRFLIPIP